MRIGTHIRVRYVFYPSTMHRILQIRIDIFGSSLHKSQYAKENQINFRKSYYNIHMCMWISIFISFPFSLCWPPLFPRHSGKSISFFNAARKKHTSGYWIIRCLQLDIQILSSKTAPGWVTHGSTNSIQHSELEWISVNSIQLLTCATSWRLWQYFSIKFSIFCFA